MLPRKSPPRRKIVRLQTVPQRHLVYRDTRRQRLGDHSALGLARPTPPRGRSRDNSAVMVTLLVGLFHIEGSGQNLVVGVAGSGFSNEPGPTMDVQILGETTFDDGSTQRRKIARLDRAARQFGN